MPRVWRYARYIAFNNNNNSRRGSPFVWQGARSLIERISPKRTSTTPASMAPTLVVQPRPRKPCWDNSRRSDLGEATSAEPTSSLRT